MRRTTGGGDETDALMPKPCTLHLKRELGLRSAENAGVAERVAPGLWIHAEPVRPAADRNPGQQPPGRRADRVDLGVVAPGQPQHLAIRRDAAHVGTAATRQ